MLITCKCLNITLEAKETERKNAEFGSLKLPSVEELETFFKEDVKEVEIVSVTKQIITLVQGKTIGVWSVEQCLNCSINCYATHINGTSALINASLITTNDAISSMKKHRDFSDVFRIIIQPVAEDIGLDVASMRQTNGKLENVVASLQQQLRESIQEEVTKTEERIRTFSELQYTQLEEFRNRAAKDQKALARKIFEVQLPFESEDIAIPNNTQDESRRVDNIDTSINRSVLAPRKSGPASAAIRQENEIKGRPVMVKPMNSNSRVQEKVAGSLDSEGLFVIEGMEDSVPNEPSHSEGESDTDHEDSGSHDEGIDVHRKLTPSFQLARSLPVNVPVYSITPSDFGHDDEPSDAVDIGASIRALARSVHGDTVFGDLPRPRFSTQI